MAANELLIKINADAKNAKAAFDSVKKQSEDLSATLTQVAKVSAVAFAAFTAEIGFAVAAFKQTEDSQRKLSAALQSQGIFTAELRDEYEALANELERKTGIDDAVIRNSTAVIQSYIGQEKVTKELIQATADFAALTGADLNSASQLIGKTIGSNVNAFARYGLQLDVNASKTEKLSKVTEFLTGIAGGQAEAQLQGLGALKRLEVAFGNVQEEIGKRFAPAITLVANKLAAFFDFISNNPVLVNFGVALLTAGTALAALGVAIPIVVTAFTALTAALAAFGVVSNVALLGIPAAIGAIVAVVTFLALNWGNNLELMKNVWQGFVELITGSAKGFANILQGIFTFDPAKIKQGLDQVIQAYKDGAKEATKALPEEQEKANEKQNAIQKKFADEKAAREKAEEALRLSRLRAENELIRLELAKASQATIDLKKKEIDTLKALESTQNAERRALLKQQLDEVRAAQEEQHAQDLERKRIFAEERRAVDEELRAEDQANSDIIQQEKLARLEAEAQTEKDIDRKIAEENLQTRVKNRALELEDRKRYGAAVATINSVLRSNEINAAKGISGELVALSQSKNNTLKSIGKTAAIAQITIATAESAVTLTRDIQRVVPFPLSIPVIAALVGARIAFGAEQIANVRGAQAGALVEGPGRGDTVPFLLEPGELVTPRKNFEEVVGGVRAQRNNRDDEIVALLQDLNDKPSGNTFVVNGDILAEDTFIQRIGKALSDAIEFNNLQIVGVNA